MEEFSEVSTGAIQSVKSTMSNLEGKIGELEQNLQDPKAAAQTSVLLLLGVWSTRSANLAKTGKGRRP